MKLVFDIGGTNIRRAVLDGSEFLAIDKHGTGGGDLKEGDLQTTLSDLIAQTMQKYTIDFIGASFAGQVNHGVISSAPNIEIGSLKNANFGEWIYETFKCQGAIDNDLKCAALAESSLRTNARSIFTLFVGTGIGGAIVENGALVRGAANNAGEIGHIPFEQTPFLCGCGGGECLEASGSGIAITKWARHYGLDAQILSDLERISAEQSLSDRSQKAYEILERFDRAIAHAVKTIAALFNPEYIVLGGGVAAANDRVLATALNALETAFKPSRDIKIELSTLGDRANLLGASLLKYS
ncbi:glucokinase [Campylobacterota bacterium]|nr:glucokinase [Campylobacterota bacterium]